MTRLSYPSSSEELAAEPGGVSRDQVLRRLHDWRDRVHKLYDDIERALANSPYSFDRRGKHTSAEELPRRVGLLASEEPEIDILRIVRSDGTNAAMIIPKGLWVIGANGRVDLRILPLIGSSEIYMLVDQSSPLSGKSEWTRIPIGSPFDREPFDPSWLASKLN